MGTGCAFPKRRPRRRPLSRDATQLHFGPYNNSCKKLASKGERRPCLHCGLVQDTAGDGRALRLPDQCSLARFEVPAVVSIAFPGQGL